MVPYAERNSDLYDTLKSHFSHDLILYNLERQAHEVQKPETVYCTALRSGILFQEKEHVFNVFMLILPPVHYLGALIKYGDLFLFRVTALRLDCIV